MVWFTCEECGDTIKKPKLQNHFHQCGSWRFSCVDCLVTFDRNSAKNHSVCVTEHEKYALGATKPGGFAANGLNREPAKGQNQGEAEPTGLEFLTTRPPWQCTICNVGCTSRDTLMSHAAGIKHKRRAKAAMRAQSGGDAQEPNSTQQEQPVQEETPAQPASTQSDGPSSVLEDEAKFSSLVKIVSKKLKRKGKVGPKKLKALSLKKLGISEDHLEDLLGSIREKLVSSGVAKLDGKKLLPA